MAAARAAWRAGQAGLNPAKLVFVDETWATTAMARRYGWGPTTARVIGRAPHGHWKVTTFVAALRADGLTAPMAVDGAINGDLFRAYVEQVLAPTLRAGDVVVMDNLQCHKVAGVAEAIRRARARVVYLPPYSPDLNPIEKSQADCTSRWRWVGTRRIGYHRRDGVVRAGRVVPATPGGSRRRNRMSATTRRPAPPRA